MSANRTLREGLRNAMIGFVSGALKSKAFGAYVGRLAWNDRLGDRSLCAIAEQLYTLYDDFTDHSFHDGDPVPEQLHQSLCRIHAFLTTDLEMDRAVLQDGLEDIWEQVKDYWPFASAEQRDRHVNMPDGLPPVFDREAFAASLAGLHPSWISVWWPILAVLTLAAVLISAALWVIWSP